MILSTIMVCPVCIATAVVANAPAIAAAAVGGAAAVKLAMQQPRPMRTVPGFNRPSSDAAEANARRQPQRPLAASTLGLYSVTEALHITDK